MRKSKLEGPARDFIIHITADRNLTKNTIAAYVCDVSLFVDFLAARGVELLEAKIADVREFIATERTRELAPQTVRRRASALRQLFDFLHIEGFISEHIAGRIRSPKVPKTLPGVLSIQQVDELLTVVAKLKSTPLGLRDCALVEVAYSSGARISEILNLRTADVALAKGVARVMGKGRKERLIRLGPPAVSAIGEYLERGRPALAAKARERGREPSPVLFLTRVGNALSRVDFHKALKKICAAAGIENAFGGNGNVSPHTLRHSFATHMVERGAEIHDVSEMLGHAHLSTTQIYLHLNPERLRAVHEKHHPRGGATT